MDRDSPLIPPIILTVLPLYIVCQTVVVLQENNILILSRIKSGFLVVVCFVPMHSIHAVISFFYQKKKSFLGGGGGGAPHQLL